MTVQDRLSGDALRLEIAIALLPLVGRVERLDDDQLVGVQGNRLTEHHARRLVIDDIACRWSALDPPARARYGPDLRPAILAFTDDYVDAVEAGGPNITDLDNVGYESAVECLWNRHVESLRADPAVE